MDAENNGYFSITMINEEVVAPVLTMQEHSLPLSNLDLLLAPVDVGVLFCYKKPMPTTMSFGHMVGSLKKALAQVLVSYYALAGEVIQNNLGEPQLLCNNRGVDFVEAVADIELQYLNFYNPDVAIGGKLVPKKKNGVLAVQATSLKCGGIVVACTVDHRIADAYSINMFLVSWAENAHPTKPSTTTTTTTSHHPCFCRSLLSPRHPGFIPPSVHNIFIPNSNISSPLATSATPLLRRIYYVPMEQVHSMQSLAVATNNNGKKFTKLESFSAFLWKVIAHAASKDKKGKMITAKMGIAVDGRKRLVNGCNNGGKELMESYFGNVVSMPFGEKPVEELMEKPLGFVADVVHDFLAVATTKEHFLGLIDWVEAHRPVLRLSRLYCNSTDDGPTFVVSSGQRFPMDKVNFGWGKVMFASYHFPWGSGVGTVMPMPSPVRNGDWVVYMHLLKEQLEIIESEASHVFRPMTWDYLNQ